jgi:hypothetical protein
MSKGGTRPGAGRPKGALNKVTLEREAELAASGLMPLDHMLAILRNENETAQRRDWASEKAAPYCHPRLTAVNASLNLTMSQEEALEFLK